MEKFFDSERSDSMQIYRQPFTGHIARLVWAPVVYSADVTCLKAQLEELYSCGLNLIRYDVPNPDSRDAIIDNITEAIDSSEILSKHVKLNLCQGV